MRRSGASLIGLVISVAVILILMLLVLHGIGGKGGEGLVPGSKELNRQPGESIPQAAANRAKGVQCQSNLRQIRLALQMALQGEEGRPPASLADLSAQGVTPDITRCPVSGQPYSYDPASGKVWCTTPGHEQF